MTTLLRTLFLGALAAAVLLGVFEVRGVLRRHADELAARDEQITVLHQDLEQKVAEIRRLGAALRFLKVDHRVARITVLDQRPSAVESGEVETTLRFQEVGPGGEPVGDEAQIDLLGRVAYLDALVIKFEDHYVEQGDFLRGTSICLFRRIFGEYQQPNEGFPIDAVGTRPRAYSAEQVDPSFEQQLWERFWDYANDRELAEQVGVRAIQGEAPYMELRPGRSYKVILRSSGGLSILPE